MLRHRWLVPFQLLMADASGSAGHYRRWQASYPDLGKQVGTALAVLACFISLSALAQPYPSRPVRVLIPFTAGSAADIIARAMEPAMRERLGQPFVADNRGARAAISRRK